MIRSVRALTFHLSHLSILVAVCLLVFGLNQFLGRPLQIMLMFKRVSQANGTQHDAPRAVRFPRNYHATGRLHLPHSGIVEPFEAWYAGDYNRSRIDYYYATDKTFQRGDLGEYGTTFKVVPMYTDKRGNYIGCWHLAGTNEMPIIPQPVVPPNMSDFQFEQYEVYMGTSTAKWEFRYLAFGMLNTQTMWVGTLDSVRPIRYEMKGYDSLLASYYDYYVLEYISFEEWKPDLNRFELPKEQSCYNYSHSLESHLVANPMQEFMSFGAWDEKAVEDMFNEYKDDHNKAYESRHEHVTRKHIFRHNMRYIRSVNRRNLTYKLAPNHIVDMTEAEYDTHKGLSKDNSSTDHQGGVHLEEHHDALSNTTPILKTVDIPEELDWRDYGAVTSVRGQGICGSCYAIAATGAVAGAYFLKTGTLVELSAQQVVDCSWGSGNHGCRGGYYNKALSWIFLHGVATAESYGQYLAQEGTCHFKGTRLGARINAFAFVPKYNTSALQRAVAKFGPACVTINTNPRSFKFYSWGLYDDPACDNSSTWHTVLVVGYGKENGVPYWLVKNSWSTSWGLDGYVKIALKNNTCGVTKNPVVALMDHTTFQFPIKEKIKSVNPDNPDSMGRKIHAKHQPRLHAYHAGPASKKRGKTAKARSQNKEQDSSRLIGVLGNPSGSKSPTESTVKVSSSLEQRRDQSTTEKPSMDEHKEDIKMKDKTAEHKTTSKTSGDAGSGHNINLEISQAVEQRTIMIQLRNNEKKILQENKNIMSTSEQDLEFHPNRHQEAAPKSELSTKHGGSKTRFTSTEINAKETVLSAAHHRYKAQPTSEYSAFHTGKHRKTTERTGTGKQRHNSNDASQRYRQSGSRNSWAHKSQVQSPVKQSGSRNAWAHKSQPHFSGKLQDIFEKLENVISRGVQQRNELYNKKFGK